METYNRYLAWAFVKMHIPIIYRTRLFRFYCPDALSMWRADTLFSKEPETIRWIDGMLAEEVLIDIGASTGIYSLYAASRGIRVYAFEPSPLVFEILVRNAVMNQNLTGVVFPHMEIGERAGRLVQRADHVKIDTDGHEVEILCNNEALFREARSIMIEESPDAKDEISAVLMEWGFQCVTRDWSDMMKGTIWESYKNAVWVNSQKEKEI